MILWSGLLLLSLLASFFLWKYLRELQNLYLNVSRIFFFLSVMSVVGSLLWPRDFLPIEGSRLMISNLAFLGSVSLVCFVLCWRKSFLNLAFFGGLGQAALLLSFMIWGDFFFQSGEASVWVWVHVGFVLIGEVLLFMAAIASLAYLWGLYQLQVLKRSPLFFGNSSLSGIDFRILQLIRVGFIFLSLGILLGIFSAKELWQGQWWLDSKVILALGSWFIYGAILLFRSFGAISKGLTAVASIFGFMLIVSIAIGLHRWSDLDRWRKSPEETPTEVEVIERLFLDEGER
ncbi:MAG: hypothetical protein EA369_06275 [Bradymonadales bacterium]|nr:MAG: hypothetical protein EA369_06275 [Bradymonadales bacterium]